MSISPQEEVSPCCASSSSFKVRFQHVLHQMLVYKYCDVSSAWCDLSFSFLYRLQKHYYSNTHLLLYRSASSFNHHFLQQVQCSDTTTTINMLFFETILAGAAMLGVAAAVPTQLAERQSAYPNTGGTYSQLPTPKLPAHVLFQSATTTTTWVAIRTNSMVIRPS